MRLAILALCAAFLASAGLGCGGAASIPAPPENAKAGPPPGTPPDMSKFAKDAKKK